MKFIIDKSGDKKAHWLINMGLQEIAWFVLYNRLAWHRFMVKNFMV